MMKIQLVAAGHLGIFYNIRDILDFLRQSDLAEHRATIMQSLISSYLVISFTH